MKNKWFELFNDATENKVEFLIDGRETFKNIVSSIEKAKTSNHYIYILGWMLDIDFPLIERGGSRTTTLYNLLKSVPREVEIRILVYANFTKFHMEKSILERLRQLPNVMIFFDYDTYSHPQKPEFISNMSRIVLDNVRQLKSTLDEIDKIQNEKSKKETLPNGYFYEERTFANIVIRCNTQNIGSHHDKVVIVKGESGLVAFCGGIDINRNRFNGYHDIQCKVEQGPAAHQILNKFKIRWKNHRDAKKFPLRGENELEIKSSYSDARQLVKVVGTYNDPYSNYRDHSLKESYFKIISNAERYIYIEDQYMVNLDVAKSLNQKIKKSPGFKKLILMVQDLQESSDILIPKKKRDKFKQQLEDGLKPLEKEKIGWFMINSNNAKKLGYHPGLHAKTLIVDDEIAIIGSANVNQRSFTHDSETSLVIFDPVYEKDTFAKRLRISSWQEYMQPNKIPIETWDHFPWLVKRASGMLSAYDSTNALDLDEIILKKIRVYSDTLWDKTKFALDLYNELIILVVKAVDPNMKPSAMELISPIIGFLIGLSLVEVIKMITPQNLRIDPSYIRDHPSLVYDLFELFWINLIDPIGDN
jgi:phosphatidylserine/phosphatidylglycerophosphate/cardiolipin synthase-like enzyme